MKVLAACLVAATCAAGATFNVVDFGARVA